MKHSTGKPTVAQQKRLDAISRMPCVACQLMGLQSASTVEVHHLVDKGTRKLSGGHDATIPLCRWHHRGLRKSPYSRLGMENIYGPSLALRKRAFIARFGTERSLLAIIDQRLATQEDSK